MTATRGFLPPSAFKIRRVCTTCAIHHYENCPACFGFGVYSEPDGFVAPVSAEEAMTGPAPATARACPTCGSTTAGIPADAPGRIEPPRMTLAEWANKYRQPPDAP